MAFFESRDPDKSIDVWDGGTCSTGDQVPPPYYHIGSLLGSNQVLPKLCGQHLHHTVVGLSERVLPSSWSHQSDRADPPIQTQSMFRQRCPV